ncbi:40S ribosomal protein S1 [Penicillium sp. IBT 18751x]|nr:40S ribosomal protein S1 [Penicillium sp. IBT 18751x]
MKLNVSYPPGVGKTLVNRTSGLKNANNSLKGRIFEVSLADLQNEEDYAFRTVKLRVDKIQDFTTDKLRSLSLIEANVTGKTADNCLTNFHGLDFTTDKLRSLVHKWQSLIEANITGKTADDCLTNFHGLDFTTNKLRSLFHKVAVSYRGQYHRKDYR